MLNELQNIIDNKDINTMKVKDMINMLKELPQKFEVNLSEYHFIEDDDGEEHYIVCLDKPISGLITNSRDKDVRFLLTGDKIAEENGDYVKEIKKINNE